MESQESWANQVTTSLLKKPGSPQLNIYSLMDNKYSAAQDYKAAPCTGILFTLPPSISFTISFFRILATLTTLLLPIPLQTSKIGNAF